MANEALDVAASSFAEIIQTQLKVFRTIVHGRENSAVIGGFIEELVRGFINSWLSPMGVYSGALWSASSEEMMQIDGIIWQPSFGPPLLRQGAFLLLHPNTIRAVVEIKTSEQNVKSLHNRLNAIWQQYLQSSGHSERDCMGVILAHQAPERLTKPSWHTDTGDGQTVELHSQTLHAHPIYILFKKTDEFTYEPFMPGIKAMISHFNYIANTPRINALIE